MILPCCYQQFLIESRKQWMRVMNYKGDCTKNTEHVESYDNCIQQEKCSYFAVTNALWLNRQNDEWEWWSMKVSVSKIWNESNRTKITRWIWTLFLLCLYTRPKPLPMVSVWHYCENIEKWAKILYYKKWTQK